MSEIKVSDIPEIKNKDMKNYKEIKPESDMSVSEARNFWNNLFERNEQTKNERMENKGKNENGNIEDTIDLEKKEKKGGSYREVFKEGEGDKYEVHHMPSDVVSFLERNDGPAIKMDKDDHRKTASCGMSKEAQDYRAMQKEYIDQGKFREAVQMDIDDIHDKFGDKYDDAIAEMLEYVDKLEEEGRI